jgi:hypothetical protein
MSRHGSVKIKCVIETKVEKEIEMVKFGEGLMITKYHPIYFNNQWRFPIDVAPIVKKYISAYYNFVLDRQHSMVVNGIACITLGHGIQEKVANHSYFGSELIIRDLQKIRGWEKGLIQLPREAFKRSPSTHEVVGIIV